MFIGSQFFRMESQRAGRCNLAKASALCRHVEKAYERVCETVETGLNSLFLSVSHFCSNGTNAFMRLESHDLMNS